MRLELPKREKAIGKNHQNPKILRQKAQFLVQIVIAV